MRATYRVFLDAHWKPHEVDVMELWQAAYLLTPADQTVEDMAVRSFKARQRGEKLTPESATAHAVHGDAIQAALAAKRAG